MSIVFTRENGITPITETFPNSFIIPALKDSSIRTVDKYADIGTDNITKIIVDAKSYESKRKNLCCSFHKGTVTFSRRDLILLT